MAPPLGGAFIGLAKKLCLFGETRGRILTLIDEEVPRQKG
jgi:hypothetical protein